MCVLFRFELYILLTKRVSVHGQHVLLFNLIAAEGAVTDSLAKDNNNGLEFT